MYILNDQSKIRSGFLKVSKLIIMVGLPGSGKSYTIKNCINKSGIFKVFSSDEYRLKICGDENCQDRNQEVFGHLYKDLKDALLSGYNCIFDATNVTRKDRRRIFSQIAGIPNVEVIAYVMRNPLEVCIKQDNAREKFVGEDVIKKFLYRYEFPQRFEGFSDIVIDNFPVVDPQYEDMIAVPDFFNAINMMKEWDQENPHHIYDLYNHGYKLANHFPDSASKWFAGILHDIGKMYTKFYDDQNIAHYYNHDCVGTYIILSKLIDFFASREQSFIEHLLFLVNYHMKGHKDFRGSNEVKYRNLFGDEWYEDLIQFADADIEASGTESIHNLLMQWIKVNKMTLNEIRNKEEFKELLK